MFLRGTHAECSGGIEPELLLLVFLELGVLLFHYSQPSHTGTRVQTMSENLAQTSCVATEVGTKSDVSCYCMYH